MTAYHLPHSPQNRVLDRFSTLPDDAEGEDGLVPLWSLLLALLDRDVTTANEAIDLLGEIAVLLRDKSGDYATLRNVLPGYMSCWPKIVGHARALSTFEPTLPLLVPGETRIIPRPHLQSMVAHQFLTTLMRPPHRPDEENGWADFEIWYHSELPHQAAAEMYLAGVLTFLGKDADGDVQFDFRAPVSPHLDVPMAPIRISLMEEYVAPHPDAMVVSANQVIGFGRSATQEEIYFGCAPEVCPAVLFVPPLGASALIISSVSPTLRIRGARRQISSEIATQTPHTFVLMDALELDEADSGDLHPDNMDREIAKAATAFGGVGGVDGTGGTGGSGGPRRIATPAWGCGAFCGDPGVKLPLLWIAASSAGVSLEVLVDPPHHVVARAFERFVNRWEGTAAELRARLGAIPPCSGEDVLAAL